MIRNTAKAIILRDEHILLQKLRLPDGHIEYELPGGGQNAGETMEEAVIRECLEETGYTVRVERFAALYEEIVTNEAYRKRFPGHLHRLFHVFMCSTDGMPPVSPSELDRLQVGISWIATGDVAKLQTWPHWVATELPNIIGADHPVYMGSLRTPSPWV